MLMPTNAYVGQGLEGISLFCGKPIVTVEYNEEDAEVQTRDIPWEAPENKSSADLELVKV